MQSSEFNENPLDGVASDSAGRDAWRRSAWATVLAAGVVVLATVAAFSNSFSGPFIFDDADSITNNPTIRQLWPIRDVLCPPIQGATVTGRPLLNLSLALNYACGRMNVRGYHAVNLAIHLLAALLLLGAAGRTFLLPAMRARWSAVATSLALAITLLWAIHPLQTESVTYISQRAESLMGLFYLLTLYCFIRGVESARAGFWYAGAVAACLLGMITKEVLVSAPLIVLLYDRTFVAGSFRAAWRRRWGLYLALAATWLPLGWMVAVTGNRGGSAGFGLSVSWWSYLCTQFGAIVHYLGLCVWPHPLVLDYGVVALPRPAAIVAYAIAVGLLGLATLVALWRWPKVGFLGAWFFAILAPTSSFVPACVTQTVAEHRMYLPLAAVITGVVLGVTFLGQWLVGRQWFSRLGLRVMGVCLVSGAAVALGIVTFHRNVTYSSDLSIWQDTVDAVPDSNRGQNNLGLALADRGQYDEALVHYQKALELKPDYPQALNNLGIVLAKHGEVEEAIASYQKALELKPDLAEAHNNLGIALAGRGRNDEAIVHYRRALELNPDYAFAHFNLGVGLTAVGRPEEALVCFQKALELKPDFPDVYYNLGVLLAASGQRDAAIAHYQKALELQPDYTDAHHNLGIALAGRGQADAAIAHYQKALELNPDYAEAHYNLANVLAAGHQVDAAIVHYQKALELKPDHAEAHNNLANILAARGQVDAAIVHCQRALKIKPDFAEAHNALGFMLASRRQVDAAIVHYQKALEIKPDFAEAHNNLGWLLANCGQADAAIAHFQKALELKPDSAVARQNCDMVLALRQSLLQWLAERRAAVRSRPSDVKLLGDTAWILATNPNASIRNAAEAIELAQRAVKLSGNQDSRALDTLAAAYAEAGRFPEAVQAAQQAIDLALQQNKPAVAAAIKARRQAYEAKTAFREPPGAVSPIPVGPRQPAATPDAR